LELENGENEQSHYIAPRGRGRNQTREQALAYNDTPL
jgi:hypothetical protein